MSLTAEPTLFEKTSPGRRGVIPPLVDTGSNWRDEVSAELLSENPPSCRNFRSWK